MANESALSAADQAIALVYAVAKVFKEQSDQVKIRIYDDPALRYISCEAYRTLVKEAVYYADSCLEAEQHIKQDAAQKALQNIIQCMRTNLKISSNLLPKEWMQFNKSALEQAYSLAGQIRAQRKQR